MAYINPRASGFWAESSMGSSYFQDDSDDPEQQNLVSDPDDNDDGRTPLDKTIDRIGMGSYQWTLLSLCGFGWMADNMWIQAIAIILPRVQQHYSVPDSYIGSVSSSMFAGMMFGAIGWGTCSDLMGRSTAFNATLFFTALFGLLASLANSFPALCIILFFLGSAVGGSMPTDGTLLLEHMPRSKQYLVTALSVFFSFGAVLSAVVALLVLPQHSCLPSQSCDPDTQNGGWKLLLIGLGLITLSMFIARIVFFRLHESPRYLVHAGRPQEAIESLQMISRFNGSDLSLELEDVEDHQPSYPQDQQAKPPPEVLARSSNGDAPPHSRGGVPRIQHPRMSSSTVFHAGEIYGETSPTYTDERPALVTQYQSTHASPPQIDTQPHTPNVPEISSSPKQFTGTAGDYDKALPPVPPRPLSRSVSSSTSTHTLRPSSSLRRSRRYSASSRRLSAYEQKVWSFLPRWLRKPLRAWWDRVLMVLEPEWFRITVLMWAIWFAMSLAFTMFNVYLPKLLETVATAARAENTPKSLEDSLWDVVIFTIGGCPGAILGAFLVESQLGRKWSLAMSTFVTAIFCTLFVMVKSVWAVRASTVGISLSATAMWAVLYGWTPEIFGTKVRGTACGIASALSRIGGMIAPMLGGVLLMMDRSVPVYTSVVIFVIAGLCVLMVREKEAGKPKKGERVVVH